MKKNGTIVEYIRNDLMKSEDLSCSETMLHAADRVYGLDLSPQAFKLASGFGGGMGVQGTCGAITGGLMALGVLFIKDRAHESTYLKELEQELFQEFREKLGSTDCSYLKERYEDADGTCKPLVLKVAQIFETLIDRELARAGSLS